MTSILDLKLFYVSLKAPVKKYIKKEQKLALKPLFNQ